MEFVNEGDLEELFQRLDNSAVDDESMRERWEFASIWKFASGSSRRPIFRPLLVLTKTRSCLWWLYNRETGEEHAQLIQKESIPSKTPPSCELSRLHLIGKQDEDPHLFSSTSNILKSPCQWWWSDMWQTGNVLFSRGIVICCFDNAGSFRVMPDTISRGHFKSNGTICWSH